MFSKLRFYLDTQPMWDSVALHIAREVKEGIRIAQPIVFEQTDGLIRTEPCLYLRHDECQGLIDELWRVGFRPSEGTGSAGALKATQDHLSDMQKIVFKLLKMQ